MASAEVSPALCANSSRYRSFPSASQLQYGTVWAMVVVATVVSRVLYTLAQALERLVSASLGDTAAWTGSVQKGTRCAI